MTATPTLVDTQFALDAAQSARQPVRTVSAEKAKQTAQEFEAQFLAQMISHMFEGIETDGMFGGGHGEEMYRSLMFDEFGKALARAGGIGLADAVQREILKAQEV